MATRDKNVPPSATARRHEKNVRSSSPQIDPYPSWRFSTVDKNGPFAWPKGDPIELEIVKKLHDFDSMKWSEIVGRDHHSLSPDSLSGEATRRLQEIGRDDDIDSVFSFHLQGEPRIICIRDRNVAKLLWFDSEHKVCPSKKK